MRARSQAKLTVWPKAPPSLCGPSLAARSASNAAARSPSTEAGRTDVDRMYPASSARLQRCSTVNSRRPAASNPAPDRTWASGRRCRARSQPARTRPSAPSTVLHSATVAASARCQSSSPAHGPDDQHSARCPPGWSQPRTRPATRSRSSRWNALPMTASSKYPGSARRVSAPDRTGRTSPAPAAAALARTVSTMSGSESAAHTSVNQRRSGKASWPVPQARSSRRPRPETPARWTRSVIIASG